ncbi:MAG TPA: rod shape-determining protein MreD [Gemmatimonadales bacterium]|nr:rod shape-determining protein MreD [Gemmatimonadales bacterium]
MRVPPDRLKLIAALVLLVALHFVLRPRFAPSPFAPDLVLVALIFLAIRTRPAVGAVAGFVVGLLSDAVSPTTFGAGAFALTIVGFAAGWLKAVVFADNLLVNALIVFAASWLRDILQVAASNQLRGGALGLQLLVLSPAAALSTAAAALVALLLLRGWLTAVPSR